MSYGIPVNPNSALTGVPFTSDRARNIISNEKEPNPNKRWWLRREGVNFDIVLHDISYDFLDHENFRSALVPGVTNQEGELQKYILVDCQAYCCTWHFPFPCLLQHHSTIHRAELRKYPKHGANPYVHLCPCAYWRASSACRDRVMQLLNHAAKDQKNDNLIRMDMSTENELFYHTMVRCIQQFNNQCPPGHRTFPTGNDERSVYLACGVCRENHYGNCFGPVAEQ